MTLLQIKLSQYTPRRSLGGEEVSSYSFPTSALDGGECVTPRPRFSPGERTPSTHWAGWASEPVWTHRLEEKSLYPVSELPRLQRTYLIGVIHACVLVSINIRLPVVLHHMQLTPMSWCNNFLTLEDPCNTVLYWSLNTLNAYLHRLSQQTSLPLSETNACHFTARETDANKQLSYVHW
jgi:hypothetical protein